MHTRDVDVFVIVSGDSDFTPLVTLLREAGRRVHGFGNVQTSDAFRVACGAFVELRQPQSPSVSAAAAKQPAKKAAATKATKAPTKKAATTKPSPQSFSPKVRDKVHAAIKASADAEGWASLSTVAKQLGPGIRPKDFGHATWTKLFTERKGFEVRDAKKPTVAVRSTL